MKIIKRIKLDEFEAIVGYSKEWDEYQVDLWKGGTYLVECTYFTSDRDDALDTAKAMVTKPPVFG